MATDAELVRRSRLGDAEAFGELVERYGALVRAVCVDTLGGARDAEEAAQDVFVRAYRHIGQLRDPARFVGWLRQVARSVCINRLRGRPKGEAGGESNLNASADPRPGPGEDVQTRELRDAVLRSVANLPAAYREPVELVYLDGRSQKDAAGRLGLSAGNVRVRLHRARQMLRSALEGYGPVEALSRSKQGRLWLPSNLSQRETAMALNYETTKRRLQRGDVEVTIRAMTEAGIAAVRRFDEELTAVLDDRNAQFPPGRESTPGGPWADDQELRAHVATYAAHGGLTLLAEEQNGRVVGFADLWPTTEPEPFGRSLDVECIDYFHEHYTMGLEIVLLEEAERVARAAGLPALDIGTNTCSGDYPLLRRFGMRIFYEYDTVTCRCPSTPAAERPEKRMLGPDRLDMRGLVRVDHWCPTDFSFELDTERTYIAELRWPGRRAVLELLSPEVNTIAQPVPANPPRRAHLCVDPTTLGSSSGMAAVLGECAYLAGEAGADKIELPCPSDIELDDSPLDVIEREFAFAWLRKAL